MLIARIVEIQAASSTAHNQGDVVPQEAKTAWMIKLFESELDESQLELLLKYNEFRNDLLGLTCP